MRLLFSLLAFLVFTFSTLAAAPNIPEQLQDVSVTVRSGAGSGSGVVFTRKDSSSNYVNLVWTAAHVVEDLRSEREVVGANGAKRTLVEFKDAMVVKVLVEDGRTIGSLALDAEVIKYSPADDGEDIAILRIRKKNFLTNSVVFYLDAENPKIGTDVYNVGSPHGQFMSHSVTKGLISAQGRMMGKKIFDQSSAPTLPGGSGGGIYLVSDGRYVGMLQRGVEASFVFLKPIRVIRKWADNNKVNWALDNAAPFPSEIDLAKLPIEDK